MVPSILVSFLALAPGQAPAEERPGPGATVDRFTGRSALRVEGARTYSSREIVNALAAAPRFLVVSHPRAPLADYLRYIEENVRLGYLRGGFPEAAVKAVAEPEGSILRIQIDEGRRLVAGPVIVEGQKSVPVEAITRAVTEPDPERKDETRWRPGEPAKLDAPFLAMVCRLVERVYARAGHFSANVEADIKTGEAGTANLVIRVEEGKASTLGEIIFQGTFTDDLKALTSAVGIRSGMAFDQDTLDSIVAKLESMGRYIRVEARPVPLGDSGRIDLHLTLFQAGFAPPLGEPVPEQQGVLRKAVQWLGDTANWKGPLVLRADASGMIHGSRLDAWLEQPILEIAVAREGLLLQARYRPKGRDLEERVGLVLAGNRGLLVAAPLSLVSRFQLTEGPTLLANLKLLPRQPEDLATSDHPMKLVVGGALKSARPGEPQFQLDLEVPESALTYFSRLKTLEYRFEDGVLHVDYTAEGDKTARFASIHRESGSVEFGYRQEESGLALSLSFEESGLEARLEEASEESRRLGHEEASPLRLLGLSGIGALKFTRCVKGEGDAAQVRCLEAVARRLLAREGDVTEYLTRLFSGGPSTEESGGEGFHIPYRDPQSSDDWAVLFGLAASRLAADMPRDSWLQALLREAACIGLGESLYTADELKRLGSSEVGPIGCWVLAETLRAIGRRPQAGMFAEAALRQCSLAGFRTELRVLRQEGSLPAMIAALGKSLRELDEAEVAFVRADAGRLGDDDEREFVRLFDAGRRIEDPVEAGASLLEAFWVSGLDDLVRSRSRALTPRYRSP